MRSFRFPRWTIVLMLLVLFNVFVAIEEARNVSVYMSTGESIPVNWLSLPRLLVMGATLACALGLIGYGVLLAMRKAGIQR
jgi:hypothetical protein